MTKEQQKQEAIQRIMENLPCSKKEAEEIYESDKEIDKEQPQYFDLPPEQMRIAETYIKIDTKKKKEEREPQTNTVKKEKPPDTVKIDFIKNLADYLSNKVVGLEIVNPTQKISFKLGEDNFSLTLTRHGKGKNK